MECCHYSNKSELNYMHESISSCSKRNALDTFTGRHEAETKLLQVQKPSNKWSPVITSHTEVSEWASCYQQPSCGSFLLSLNILLEVKILHSSHCVIQALLPNTRAQAVYHLAPSAKEPALRWCSDAAPGVTTMVGSQAVKQPTWTHSALPGLLLWQSVFIFKKLSRLLH